MHMSSWFSKLGWVFAILLEVLFLMLKWSAFFLVLNSFFRALLQKHCWKENVSATCFLLRCPEAIKRWIFVFNLLHLMSFFLFYCLVISWSMPLQWIFIFSLNRKRADVARIVSRTDQMTEQKRPPQKRVHSLLYWICWEEQDQQELQKKITVCCLNVDLLNLPLEWIKYVCMFI